MNESPPPHEPGTAESAQKYRDQLSEADREIWNTCIKAGMTDADSHVHMEHTTAFNALLPYTSMELSKDKHFAVYLWADEGFEPGLNPDEIKVLGGSRSIVETYQDGDGGGWGWNWNRYHGHYDLGRSIFLIDDLKIEDRRAKAAFKKCLAANNGGLTGVQLASLMVEHNISQDPRDIGWIQYLLCVETDGTLLDAMRAATVTMGGLNGLSDEDRDSEVEPEFNDQLDMIQSQSLRTHIEMFCQTEEAARCYGGHLSGYCGTIGWLPQFQVTGWHIGEGQAELAVLEVGDSFRSHDIPSRVLWSRDQTRENSRLRRALRGCPTHC